jgi:multicomponent Na+:H+ antiporter subunit D
VVFSMIHHIIITTALFVIAGLVDEASGSSSMRQIGGMVRTTPLLAAMFLVTALSVAGIPPLSGFISKFSLIQAGVAQDEYAIVAVSLVVSLLTLFSMVRIWIGAFWSPPEATFAGAPDGPVPTGGGPALMVAPTAVLVACSLAVAVAAGPIYTFSEAAARELIDRSQYIDQVLHP